MKLLIAIPALNEETSLGGVIERCLELRSKLDSGSVSAVDITVISDGSTDQTVAIAKRFEPLIRVIVFDKNKGYGTAIQCAWRASDAELLGVLDADGTCEPASLVRLADALVERDADLALGCRMGEDSAMPPLRALGNRVFACLLSVLSGQMIRDIATGQRVLREPGNGQRSRA